MATLMLRRNTQMLNTGHGEQIPNSGGPWTLIFASDRFAVLGEEINVQHGEGRGASRLPSASK